MIFELSRPAPTFRALAITVLVMIPILTVAVSLFLNRRKRDLHDFAANIERKHGNFRSALVTSVEIGTEADHTEPVADWVLEGLEQQVQDGMLKIDPDLLTRQAFCRRSLHILLATILLMSLAAGIHRDTVPKAFASLFQTHDPQDPTTLEEREVAAVVESVVIEIQPPAYADRRKRTYKGFTGSIRCMRGSEITLKGQLVARDVNS